MTRKNRLSALVLPGVVYVLLLIVLVACGQIETPAPEATDQPVTPTVLAVSTSAWNDLLQSTPFAYFTPLPQAQPSPLDGTYAKVDQGWPQWWRCLRCADYRVTGGIWKLQFQEGVMRILYEVNNWRSIASYSISEDRLFIFNDPYCPEHTGEYKWNVQGGALTLELIDDPCAFDLRAENLTKQSWQACSETTPGCEAHQSPLPAPVTPAPPLRVTVYGGDSRFFATPPDVVAHANSADTAPPEGISVTFAPESIPYGLQRVLWWNGDWSEASFDGSYTSAGVQFLGEEMIGWARVLFDGQEVWRGNTSLIWAKYGRHGGYVEVTGFGPGPHSLRVESMGFDYRPVTVAGFGFSTAGGVSNGEAAK